MARTPPSLRRAQPALRTNPVHWVFCEGKTEQRCLDELRRHWRLPSVTIEVVGAVGDPMGIYKKAKNKAGELKRTCAGRSTVHVVFDRDAHARFDEAVALCDREGFSLGVSVPCLELWALLLHRDQRAELSVSDVQQQLRQVHGRYHHEVRPYLEIDLVLAGLDAAARRAAELVCNASASGDRFANPSTTFHEVVERLRSS